MASYFIFDELNQSSNKSICFANWYRLLERLPVRQNIKIGFGNSL